MAQQPPVQAQPANQLPAQYSQIYTLGVTAGIKRDGTQFESSDFTDGVWCRFQRGVPKKIGGYTQLFSSFRGPARGMVLNGYNGVNYIFAGNQLGLDVFLTGQTLALGAGPYSAQFLVGYSQFAVSANTTTSFTITSTTNYTGLYSTGTKVVFAQSATPTFYTVTTSTFSGTATVVNFGPSYIGTITNVWLANDYFAPNPDLLWQFDFQYSPLGGALNLVMHPGLNLSNIDNGVNTQVYLGSTVPNSGNQWVFTGLADTAGTSPTHQPISVDGGVCTIHPFLFVYGSNGYIANNNVSSVYGSQTLNDWNGPLANQVNMASGKVVFGIPVRGGTSSPSGLFWATDSLIRVSFVNNGSTYWQYDIVSSQISIMSSRSVVEMDGLYYWMGVDRFYVYNGPVTVLPNDKNVNWLFNNLNYQQRQYVWATKVPRYNEIWFFYPRGLETECTDAIIYNVKDKIWYDAGQAEGARRSSGFTTEIFPTPIWAGWDYNTTYSIEYDVVATPSGMTAPTIFQIYAPGNLTPTFSPGTFLTFTQVPFDPMYQIATSIYNVVHNVTLITVLTTFPAIPPPDTSFYSISGGYGIWQHEVGLNKVTLNAETAIDSSFTTCDISWVGGTPSSDATPAVNRRLHLRRVEPDFVLGGTMSMSILGRKFAQSPTEVSGPYYFDANTEKIDLRLEYRQLSLQFVSNDINGNYEMGRVLVTAEYGDERP